LSFWSSFFLFYRSVNFDHWIAALSGKGQWP
jgi:hypothetical protein